ncbi:hypothetical protein Bca4012_075589 [Brassica carinata]|uniref:Uncharacterized protein n=2 Tax=Brassica TaxID=3705 RepID=A0A0D2ZR13_BRAOL|nr:unnamed protein product [Brassica napus]
MCVVGELHRICILILRAHSLQSIPHENIAELEIRDSSQSQILRLDDAGYAIGLDFWIFFCNRQ